MRSRWSNPRTVPALVRRELRRVPAQHRILEQGSAQQTHHQRRPLHGDHAEHQIDDLARCHFDPAPCLFREPGPRSLADPGNEFAPAGLRSCNHWIVVQLSKQVDRTDHQRANRVMLLGRKCAGPPGRSEIPLPRHDAHRADDQRAPALAATPLFPGGALATAWDDYGRVFGPTQGKPDVVAELIPVPILRTTLGGGGQ